MRKKIQETFNSAIEESKENITPPPKKKPINDPFSTPYNKTCNPKHITRNLLSAEGIRDI